MGESTMPDIEIEQFRSEARAWLEANMEPRPPVSRLGSSDSRTPEEIAVQPHPPAEVVRRRMGRDLLSEGVRRPRSYRRP